MSLDPASSGVFNCRPATQAAEEFKILIASDVHLGYAERDALRGDDSFRAFEEVLQAAQKHDVDLILLAGDLFHVNKPTISTMNRASALIRKYCFGEYEDATAGPRFKIQNHPRANYLDPNLKVRYPIFTIHGNHDDPTGVNQMSVIDLLDSSGLLNYIGKRSHVDDVVLKPIVLEKGATKIALYGLGSMHEERLHHLIQSDKFNYMVPEQDDLSQFFKVILVHQNRIARPNTKYLNPSDLDTLPDLVIWGHEHGCVGNLEFYESGDFFILQPGSTVATSLCDAEAGDKCYGIMTVAYDHIKEKPKFKVKMHRLETVRPFLVKTVSADDLLLKKKKFKTPEEAQDYLYSCCKSEIREMLQTVRVEYQTTLRPLIRLRVEYTNSDYQFDVKRFSRDQFDTQVANPNELVRFVKRANISDEYRKVMDEEENFNMVEMMSLLDDDVVKQPIQISTIMADYFGNLTNEAHKLSVFPERYLTAKVVDFVEKDTTDGFSDMVDNYKQGLISLLGDQETLDLADIKEAIKAAKNRIEEDDELLMNFDKVIQKAKVTKILRDRESANTKAAEDDEMGDNSEIDYNQPGPSTIASPSVEAKPKRGPGRPRKNPLSVSPRADDGDQLGSDLDSQSTQSASPKKPRGRPRGRGRGRGRGTGRGRPPSSARAAANNISASSVFDEDTEEDSEGEARAKISSYFKRTRK